MLLDAHGQALAERREVVITNPDIARFVSMADVPFKACGLTVVCVTCGGTPQMANHPTDATWKMECACTTRVLRNPTTN